jgi:hypothetical protein
LNETEYGAWLNENCKGRWEFNFVGHEDENECLDCDVFFALEIDADAFEAWRKTKV